MRNDIYYGMPVYGTENNRQVKIRPDEKNYCYDPSEDCALIIERTVRHYKWNAPDQITRSLRILTGSGPSGEKVGDEIGWVTDTGLGHRNDYTGQYKIIGIMEPDGTQHGEIPARKLPHYVMK